MSRVNETWAANVLNMKRNTGKGPDLIDEHKIVEVKFKLIDDNKYTYLCWRILGHQKDYEQNEKNAYLGLGKYFLSLPVSEIKIGNELELENLVTSRELFIVPWGWVAQFPVYHESGKTATSKWENNILFAKGRLLPDIIEKHEVAKGFVYLTQGVNKGDFNIQ